MRRIALTHMELRHPIDGEIRARLRGLGGNQSAIARQIGHSPSWLNKYLSGKGHATIDDIVRIAAVLIGAHAEPLSGIEERLLRAFRGLSDDDRREDHVALLEAMVRKQRKPPSHQRQPPESHAPVAHKHPEIKRKER